MNAYYLPESITVSGQQYALRTDFCAVLDVLIACNDPELNDEEKTLVMLEVLLPEWANVPQEYLQEALQKLVQFIDCGHTDEGDSSPRVVDWEQDAEIIVAAVNGVAHTEIRAVPKLHWWTFMSYFMEIRESVCSNVLAIRQKKAKGKKLEKWEQDFYKENRRIIDFHQAETDEIRAEKENILKYL